jgi:hypothetical protein
MREAEQLERAIAVARHDGAETKLAELRHFLGV